MSGTAPVTLITGASSGIGEALAYEAARAGRRLALVARSQDRLQHVADTIASQGHPKPEIFTLDLTEIGTPERLSAMLKARGLTVAELVNNAGYSITGRLENANRQEQIGMIELNVRALTELTYIFLPDIVAARGGILNVGSTASFTPGPRRAVYNGSKAFVLYFSEALAYELKGQARVTALCPGPTPTRIQERALPGARRTFLLPHTSVEQVAAAGWQGFERGARVVVPGLFNKLVSWLAPILPRRFVLRAADRVTAKRDGD